MIRKGIELRLKVNKEQEKLLLRSTGACRFVYNKLLEEQIDNYNDFEKFLTFFEMCELLKILKEDHPWLEEAESTSLRWTAKNLSQALRNFFQSKNGTRKGRKMGFPKFKSVKTSRRSMTIAFNNNSIRVESFGNVDRIKLNKLGYFSVYNWKKRLKLLDDCKIKNATIYQASDGNWYVSVCVECDNQVPLPNFNRPLGIDLGAKTFVTASTGDKIDALEPLQKDLEKLKRLQRVFSRKLEFAKKRPRDANGRIVFSNNMLKLKKRIGKLHRKIVNKRKNFNHQFSKKIVEYFDVIVMEDLDIQGMLKTLPKYLRRQIQDMAWYQLLTFVKYKCEWYGKKFIQVSRWFPSSKTCSNCGQRVDPEDHRRWRCPTCKVEQDRDINAAKVLERVARYYMATGKIVTVDPTPLFV